MLKDTTVQLIRESLGHMKHPVRIVLFTSDTGCPQCPSAIETAQAIKSSGPRIALETYDITMDRDKTEAYGVKRAPSFVVESPDGRTVTFSGAMEGISLVLLLETIAGISEGRVWLPEKVIAPLKLLEKDVHVQVFLDNDCSLCKPVGETAVGLALANNRVWTDLIVADDFPDLASKLSIKLIPTTVFGRDLRSEGHVPEGAFLEMLFQAEGQKAAQPEKRCVVCGNPSPDVICTDCKAKIQAEAVEHKRADEKLKQAGTVVKPRKNP
jgi:alkyl hydroperoxide reductase subunit AhpF